MLTTVIGQSNSISWTIDVDTKFIKHIPCRFGILIRKRNNVMCLLTVHIFASSCKIPLEFLLIPGSPEGSDPGRGAPCNDRSSYSKRVKCCSCRINDAINIVAGDYVLIRTVPTVDGIR